MKPFRIVIPVLFAAVVALSLAIMPASAQAARPNPVPVTQPAVIALDAVEIADLEYMREEEKLARDAHLTLYDVWGVRTFQNISRSEQSHMDAILTLLNRYAIADPAVGNGVGEFTNPELQALYDQLIATGSQSLADALKVGGAIRRSTSSTCNGPWPRPTKPTSNGSTPACSTAPPTICGPSSPPSGRTRPARSTHPSI